jgi:hypothetical protein
LANLISHKGKDASQLSMNFNHTSSKINQLKMNSQQISMMFMIAGGNEMKIAHENERKVKFE